MTLNLHDYDEKVGEIINRTRAIKVDTDVDAEKDILLSLRGSNCDNIWDTLLLDKGQTANIDTINKVTVDELLPFVTLIWKKSRAILNGGIDDFRNNLVEQLTDMKTGMCSQGRCIRLCQLINSYWDLVISI